MKHNCYYLFLANSWLVSGKIEFGLALQQDISDKADAVPKEGTDPEGLVEFR